MWDNDELRVRLEGRLITLEPLISAHVDGLRAAAEDERTWTWMVTRDIEAVNRCADEGLHQIVTHRMTA